MNYTYEEVLEAYTKLRTYIYYDSSNLFMRISLSEFETGLTDDSNFINRFTEYSSFKKNYNVEYPENLELYEQKLHVFTAALNSHHSNPEYFNTFLSRIKSKLIPKKIEDSFKDTSIITNKRTQPEYSVQRTTLFFDAPIEIHLISVLWLMRSGMDIDRTLSDFCFGNRLILNKKKDAVVKGSGLFKPYPRQYQKWRDVAINSARELLNKGHDVAILNLDIRDFFYSCRIPVTDIFASPYKTGGKIFNSLNNLYSIFGDIHVKFTSVVLDKSIPYNFDKEVKNQDGTISKVILPIGLLSSFVLANHHLSKFDERILSKIQPASYGRYVDDILIVFSDPKVKDKKSVDNEIAELNFDFEKYKKWLIASDYDESEKNFTNESNLTDLELFVLEQLHPIVSLIDSPVHLYPTGQNSKVFKLNTFERLYCQSEKTVLYYFDKNETSLVIDKLKRELEEKSSEFRNYDDSDEDDDFEESAYHLLYDGTEGKIRTLKDYKEDRFGLSIFLSKRIFKTLRNSNTITDDDAAKIVGFFKGINTLNLYTLWERVFTLLLVNNKPMPYVEFYFNCIDTIEKMKSKSKGYTDNEIQSDTLSYLDYANELTLSLRPDFLSSVREANKTYVYTYNDQKNQHQYFQDKYQPTNEKSYFISRFRRSNLVRHHYTAQPLISYTNSKEKSNYKDYTELKLNLGITQYGLKDSKLKHSPRSIRLWESCLATFYQYISTSKKPIRPAHNLIEKSFENYKLANSLHSNSFVEMQFSDIIVHHQKKFENTVIDEYKVLGVKKNEKPKIAVVNTKVALNNIVLSLRSTPNLQTPRFGTLYNIFKQAESEKADIVLFPECFVPIEFLDRIVWYSAKEQKLIVTGLEHIAINGVAYNFIVTILPFQHNGIKDALVSFRLKNHYSPAECELIETNHLAYPPVGNIYNLFNWSNIYFSPYYCFELADVHDRSLFKGKIDLMIASEYNMDVNYFSNIVESISRDLHVYVAQVNTSQFGDTRITQPASTIHKDILKLKGGTNDAILVGELNIPELRDFQRQLYITTKNHPFLKPLPPNYDLNDVLTRINNGTFF